MSTGFVCDAARQTSAAAEPILAELGAGIWLASHEVPEPMLEIGGVKHTRFLNRLYVPGPTHLLTAHQIAIINRYRTENMWGDPQFSYNRAVRNIFSSLCESLEGPALELGPSVFPIIPNDRTGSFVCDIDASAIEHNTIAGYASLSPPQLSRVPSSSIRLAIAAFVLHFDLPKEEACAIARVLREGGVMAFNVITKCAETRTKAASVLSEFGLRFVVFDLCSTFGKDDALFLASKDPASRDFAEANSIVRNLLMGIGNAASKRCRQSDNSART